MANITLTSSIRYNLLSLKTISAQMNKTQNLFATGKKVNSAIDNPNNSYQAKALTNRASDLMALLDNMSKAIQTIQVANLGLSNASELLEQATAVANQALTSEKIERSYQSYINEGYKEINASMSAEEIQNLLVADAKIILKEDITLSQGLLIDAQNITIFGMETL